MLGALALGAHAHAVRDSGSSRPTAESVDEAFRLAVAEKRVPGIAAIALNRDSSVIYNNSWGTINIEDPSSAAVTSSTKMAIASMTKSVVAVAALQLVEQDKLRFDDLVEHYLPSWKNVSVLEGFDAEGQPILRAPKTKATILNLFTHTTSQAYEFLDEKVARWDKWAAQQPVRPAQPLVADPGAGWFYGYDIDTLGNVVETISGLRLDAYMEHNIFRPLGLKNSGFIEAEMYAHRRTDDTNSNSSITATPGPSVGQPTEVPSGGGFLVSTIDDYANYLVALINWGTHPTSGVTILKSSTVKSYLFADLLPRAIAGDGSNSCNFTQKGPGVGVFNSTNPSFTRSAEFLPGVDKGWTASWLTNNEDMPGRRRAGSGAWAGIWNLYYWVDIKSGKLGAVFTNLLPFVDPEVMALFDKLEEFVYA
ncbi:beta-lactamase/transpeptidase-like protein [Cladorrhinum samala]|uniref:Beta-lactamase/transpeptidase-like protein n=1 Tax=Cladorrhinum samala TaxID=585594 RepID=A0AAV9HKX5_9PEZI|nr:beta-lactamase/transpeptidase-like protein [Cladorrhinum samala]